jgi:glycosyltransferase XagB
MWALTLLYFIDRMHFGLFIESLFPTPVLYMGVMSLFLGNFLYAYYYVLGCIKSNHHELVKYVFLVPFYWLLMSAAGWTALYKLITAPHHWFKTKHGVHLTNEKSILRATSIVGTSLINRRLILQNVTQ